MKTPKEKILDDELEKNGKALKKLIKSKKDAAKKLDSDRTKSLLKVLDGDTTRRKQA